MCPAVQPPEDLGLFKGNTVLDDAKKLNELKIENDDILALCYRSAEGAGRDGRHADLLPMPMPLHCRASLHDCLLLCQTACTPRSAGRAVCAVCRLRGHRHRDVRDGSGVIGESAPAFAPPNTRGRCCTSMERWLRLGRCMQVHRTIALQQHPHHSMAAGLLLGQEGDSVGVPFVCTGQGQG